ncbi:MAG: CHAT domain-containing tetratricopeptide repeat protein, partial [Mariprofundaceae bacterium]
SRLLAEPDVDHDQRRRLLLNRALQQLQAGQFGNAEDDLKQVQEDSTPIRDRTGLLRLSDVNFKYDPQWIADSMLADSARMKGAWLEEVRFLQVKLNKLDALSKPAKITAIAHYQLGMAFLRKSAWHHAREQVWQSEQLASQLADREMLKKSRWLRLRLDLNLGHDIHADDLQWLQKVSTNEQHPMRSLQMRLFVLLTSSDMETQDKDLRQVQSSVQSIVKKQQQWAQLLKDISDKAPALQPLADYHHIQWMNSLGHHTETSELKDLPWLAWYQQWVNQDIDRKYAEKTLSRLIRRLEEVFPMHQEMIEVFYHDLAQQALDNDQQRQALNWLFVHERKLAQLRQQAVSSRPLPKATTIKKLRRQMKSDEAMVLWWQHQQTSKGGELWWLDHDQLFHRHIKEKESQTWIDSVVAWKGDKKLIYLVQIKPQGADVAALKRATGVHVLSSPTLLHAAYIDEALPLKAGESDDSWSQRQWELAESSLMDWRLMMKRGIKVYKKKHWKQAIRDFKEVLRLGAPAQHREKVLQLLGFSALHAGIPEDVESLFSGSLKSKSVKLLKLRIIAEALEKRGELFAAAGAWKKFYQQGQKWSDHVLAAKSLVRLALQGVVDIKQARQAVFDALDRVPANAVNVRVHLLLDQVTMSVQLQGGFNDSGQFHRWVKKIRSLAGQQKMANELHRLQLLQITSAWKQGQYNGLLEQVEVLRSKLVVNDLMHFDVDNLEALILQSMGRLGEARIRFNQAKDGLAEIDLTLLDERLAGVHNNLGRLELAAGDLKQARAHFQYALELDRRKNNKMGIVFDQKNLAVLALRESKTQEASRRIQKALRMSIELNAKTQQVALLLLQQAGGLLLEKDVPSSLKTIRDILDNMSLPELEWQYHWLKGRHFVQAGDQQSGEIELLLAIEKIEAIKGSDASDDLPMSRAKVYETLISLWIDQKPLQALKISERFRQLTLRRLLGSDTETPSWQGKMPKKNQPLKLIYHVGAEQSWVWLLSSQGVTGRKIAMGRKALNEAVSDIMRRVQQQLPLKQEVIDLSANIWQPMHALLPKTGRIDLILPAPLNQIPFVMLRSEKDWLLSRYQFRYVHSLTSISDDIGLPHQGLAMSQSHAESMSPLLLADAEVQSIADFLPRRIQTQSNVSERDVLKAARENDWLHIASHAVLDDRSPRFSRIHLVASGKDDGRLHVYEILKHQWKASTIVLSACDTGIVQSVSGGLFAGKGANSLSQAFLHSGAKRVVSSLWNVNDTSSALLMKWFYRALASKQSVADALRSAQVQMKQRFTHPTHWAQFRLELR